MLLNIALPTRRKLSNELLAASSWRFLIILKGNQQHLEVLLKCMELVNRARSRIKSALAHIGTHALLKTLLDLGWQRKLDPEYNVMQTLLLKADWAKSLSYTTEGLMAP
ncbi:hypothetical protein ACE6H2_011757 [Prunus campanulata]